MYECFLFATVVYHRLQDGRRLVKFAKNAYIKRFEHSNWFENVVFSANQELYLQKSCSACMRWSPFHSACCVHFSWLHVRQWHKETWRHGIPQQISWPKVWYKRKQLQQTGIGNYALDKRQGRLIDDRTVVWCSNFLRPLVPQTHHTMDGLNVVSVYQSLVERTRTMFSIVPDFPSFSHGKMAKWQKKKNEIARVFFSTRSWVRQSIHPSTLTLSLPILCPASRSARGCSSGGVKVRSTLGSHLLGSH